MVQKMTILIFLFPMRHDDFLKVVYLVCSDLPLFSRKSAKTVQDANLDKNGGHKCAK